MEINTAEYIGSWQKNADMPHTEKPEFAFIGRSNVGKSSLINMLTQRNGLAKTSSTPGKTQSINLFLLNKQIQFVDLPGYGYAKVSKVNRMKFEKFISEYLLQRETLINTFVLIDSRLEPQHTDSSFVPNVCSQTQAQIVTWMHRHRQNADAEWLQILVELSGILYSSETAHESRGAMLMRGGSHLAIATPTSTSASILFQVFHSFINVGKLILF